GDPNHYYNLPRPKAGYKSGWPYIYGGTDVDQVCAAGCASWGGYYTGYRWEVPPLGSWRCQCRQNAYPNDYFNETATPYCSDPGFVWSDTGNVYIGDYVQWQPGICASNAFGRITFTGFDGNKTDAECKVGCNPTHPALGTKA